MKNQNEPTAIVDQLTKTVQGALKKYSKSKHTTNAGAILRFLAGILPLDSIIKMAAHKIAPQNQ